MQAFTLKSANLEGTSPESKVSPSRVATKDAVLYRCFYHQQEDRCLEVSFNRRGDLFFAIVLPEDNGYTYALSRLYAFPTYDGIILQPNQEIEWDERRWLSHPSRLRHTISSGLGHACLAFNTSKAKEAITFSNEIYELYADEIADNLAIYPRTINAVIRKALKYQKTEERTRAILDAFPHQTLLSTEYVTKDDDVATGFVFLLHTSFPVLVEAGRNLVISSAYRGIHVLPHGLLETLFTRTDEMTTLLACPQNSVVIADYPYDRDKGMTIAFLRTNKYNPCLFYSKRTHVGNMRAYRMFLQPLPTQTMFYLNQGYTMQEIMKRRLFNPLEATGEEI